MNEDDLIKITDSITGKIGDENSAMISDDLGILITKNSEALKQLKSRDDEIARLKSQNEKLVTANGNLLQQIPMTEDLPPVREEKEENELSNFSFRDAFDAKGNFKR